MKVSKFNFMSILGGLGGGVASKFIESFTKSDNTTEGETDWVTIGVDAVGGAALSAFSKNDLLKGLGAGMVGVAGYKLGESFGIGESDSTTSKTSGVGLLPSQNAVGLLPSQNAVGKFPFRPMRQRVRGVEGENENKAVANVQ